MQKSGLKDRPQTSVFVRWILAGELLALELWALPAIDGLGNPSYFFGEMVAKAALRTIGCAGMTRKGVAQNRFQG